MVRFERPTLPEILTRVSGDIAARTTGKALLRRMVERALGFAVAGVGHGTHGHLAWLRLQLFPQTADAEALSEWADWLEVPRKPGARAVGRITTTGAGTLPVDTLMTSDSTGQAFRSGLSTGPNEYLAEALVIGSAQNLALGDTLTLSEPVPGVDPTVTVSMAFSGGSEIEDIDDWRERVLAELRAGSGFTGKPGDYERYALRVEGVTRAWERDNRMGLGTISLAFVYDARTDIIPLASDVTAMQNFFAPIQPADMKKLYVAAPIPNFLHITMGATGTATQAAFASAVDAMLRSDADLEQPIARSQLDETLSLVDGEQTHTITQIQIVERGIPRTVPLTEANIAPGSWGLLVFGSLTLVP